MKSFASKLTTEKLTGRLICRTLARDEAERQRKRVVSEAAVFYRAPPAQFYSSPGHIQRPQRLTEAERHLDGQLTRRKT